jgi:hypothetical protein
MGTLFERYQDLNGFHVVADAVLSKCVIKNARLSVLAVLVAVSGRYLDNEHLDPMRHYGTTMGYRLLRSRSPEGRRVAQYLDSHRPEGVQ